jgi:dihydrofolate reductase
MASKTLSPLGWSNSELINGDAAKEVRSLKGQDGPDLQVHGSGDLIQTLLKHDWFDELWLKISPITLGRGKRLFAENSIPVGSKLLDRKNGPSGVIVATYVCAGIYPRSLIPILPRGRAPIYPKTLFSLA